MTCACGREMHRSSRHAKCHVCRGQHNARDLHLPMGQYAAGARNRLASTVRHVTDPDELKRIEAEILASRSPFRRPDNAPLIYAARKPDPRWRRR